LIYINLLPKRFWRAENCSTGRRIPAPDVVQFRTAAARGDVCMISVAPAGCARK
jgi:hypothetical protein